MANLQDFIGQAASRLDVSEKTAESATGGLLRSLRSAADPGDFGQLLEKVPGAASLVAKGGGDAKGGGSGLLGGLAGMAGGLLGGETGGALSLVSTLAESGLDATKAGSFVGMFVTFLKGQAGDGLVQRLLGAAPELAKLAR